MAYAPYSRFPVGAAVQTASGEVFRGCNVENASSGLTLCAERVAIASAVAAGHRDLIALAVAVSPSATAAASRMPCGACLQVMAEFLSEEATIWVDGCGVFRLRELLPRPFVLTGPSSDPPAG